MSSSHDISLGVHVGHDAAAAIFVDARLRFAEEEERHSGRKAHNGCPWQAIDAALDAVSAGEGDVRAVALTWQLPRYFECRRELAEHARSVGNEAWFEKRRREIAVVRDAVAALEDRFRNARILDFPHHQAHLACAVYFAPEGPAGRREGPVLGVVADALGDAESLTAFLAPDPPALAGTPEVVLRRPPRQSIGFFYKRSSEALGFRGSEACGYLMSLSGCSDSRDMADTLQGRLFVRDDRGLPAFREDDGFDPFRGHAGTAGRCFPGTLTADLGFDGAPGDGDFSTRGPQASGIQRVTEAYIEAHVRDLVARHGARTVFLSGGVFLNCVALERLVRSLPDTQLVVCPVKKDSGTAIGSAVLAEVAMDGKRVFPNRERTLRLGTAITGREADWTAGPGRYERLATAELVARLAHDIEEGHLVALVDGHGEFGPRALGARSILARPDNPELAGYLNREVKKRYPFQPFAGAFLGQVQGGTSDEFMSYAVRLGKSAEVDLAGLRHADGTCRAQIVPASEETVLRRLLQELVARGSPGVVLNTSLNPRGQPMPRTAADARRACAELGIGRVYTPVGRWTS